MKKFKAIITDDEAGVYAVSIVDVPATMVAMITMSNGGGVVLKEKKKIHLSSEERREVIAPLLIPGQNIYRNDNGEEFMVVFDDETIRQSATKFINNPNRFFDLMHNDKKVDGIALMDSVVSDDGMMVLFGNSSGFPKGTWYVRLKIENDDVWGLIKEGKLNGLSIGGLFTLVEEQEQDDDVELFNMLDV